MVETKKSIWLVGLAVESGNMDQGKSFTQTFTKAGTCEYKCTIHPTMVGTVIVK